MDDVTTKHMCIWPLAWHDKYKPPNSMTPLQRFLTFSFTSQREREARKDERTHHGAMDNLIRNNRSVLPCWYSVFWEKTGSILLPLVGFMAGRPADEIQVGFKILRILYRLNYLGFYFVCYHCNVATVLKLHFSQILSSKTYFKMRFEVQKFR